MPLVLRLPDCLGLFRKELSDIVLFLRNVILQAEVNVCMVGGSCVERFYKASRIPLKLTRVPG